MKRKTNFIWGALAFSLLFAGCQDIEKPENTIPTVKTDEVTEIGMNKATVTGSVSSGSYCKFLISTQSDLSDARIIDAYDIQLKPNNYKGEITDLAPGTTYYVALKASDGRSSEIIGNVESFKTKECMGIESVMCMNWDEDKYVPFTGDNIITFTYAVSDEELSLEYSSLWVTYEDGGWTLPFAYKNIIGFKNRKKRIYAYTPYIAEQDMPRCIHVYANTNDVLYGHSQDMSESDPNAKIILNHALTKVTFDIKMEEGTNSDLTIDMLNLRNANTDEKVDAIRLDGFLDLFTGGMSEGIVHYGHDGLFKECNFTLSAEKAQGVDFYVIPNSFSEGHAMLVLSEKGNSTNSFVVYLGDTTWKSGKHYTYPITITPVGVQMGDVRIDEWENNEGGTITIN